jgi:hypothetical protein
VPYRGLVIESSCRRHVHRTPPMTDLDEAPCGFARAPSEVDYNLSLDAPNLEVASHIFIRKLT